MKSLIPESRKLRVLLITVAVYLANTKLAFLDPEQIDTLVQLIMVWIGGQSLADAGLGKVLTRDKLAAQVATQIERVAVEKLHTPEDVISTVHPTLTSVVKDLLPDDPAPKKRGRKKSEVIPTPVPPPESTPEKNPEESP